MPTFDLPEISEEAMAYVESIVGLRTRTIDSAVLSAEQLDGLHTVLSAELEWLESGKAKALTASPETRHAVAQLVAELEAHLNTLPSQNGSVAERPYTPKRNLPDVV
jgi:hypothetical protein